jgi:hypothetical protein
LDYLLSTEEVLCGPLPQNGDGGGDKAESRRGKTAAACGGCTDSSAGAADPTTANIPPCPGKKADRLVHFCHGASGAFIRRVPCVS